VSLETLLFPLPSHENLNRVIHSEAPPSDPQMAEYPKSPKELCHIKKNTEDLSGGVA